MMKQASMALILGLVLSACGSEDEMFSFGDSAKGDNGDTVTMENGEHDGSLSYKLDARGRVVSDEIPEYSFSTKRSFCVRINKPGDFYWLLFLDDAEVPTHLQSDDAADWAVNDFFEFKQVCWHAGAGMLSASVYTAQTAWLSDKLMKNLNLEFIRLRPHRRHADDFGSARHRFSFGVSKWQYQDGFNPSH